MSTLEPMISIIIPIYQVDEQIRKCVESILSQTVEDYELILIVDGSSDLCDQICDSYSSSDSRIQVLHQKNGGVSSARNAGLSLATGKYVSFIDPDDWIEENFYKHLLGAVKNTDLGYCSMSLDYETRSIKMKTALNEGNYTLEDIYAPLFFGVSNKKGCILPTSLVVGLFRKEIIDKNHIRFDTGVRFAEDWLFYASYFRFVHSVGIVDKALYHYFQRSDSVIHSFSPATKLGIEKGNYILAKFSEFANETPVNHEIYDSLLLNRYNKQLLNISINLWNKQNQSTIKEKKDLILTCIEITNLPDKANLYQKAGMKEKMVLWMAKHKCVGLISLYGIFFNITKTIYHTIKS